MPTKRANGQGCIYYNRQRGKWIVSITLYKDNSTGKYVRKTKTCLNEQHAHDTLEQMNHDKNNGILIFDYSITIEDWILKWLKEAKSQTIELSTYNNYLSNIKNHIIPMLGHIKVRQLRIPDIQNFYNQLYISKINPKTVQRIHVILNASLEYAISNDLITKNPAQFAKRKKMMPYENNPYTALELQDMLEKIKDEKYFVPILMLSLLGLRRGELLALTLDDIDWKQDLIKVNRSLSRDRELNTDKYSYKLKTTKTISSKRFIGMNERLKAILKKYINDNYDTIQSNQNNLIFCTQTGDFMNPNSLTYYFRTMLEKHDLRIIRLHDLRHSFGMMMIRGTSYTMAKELLGHSSIFTTINIYNHIKLNEIKEATKILDAVY